MRRQSVQFAVRRVEEDLQQYSLLLDRVVKYIDSHNLDISDQDQLVQVCLCLRPNHHIFTPCSFVQGNPDGWCFRVPA